MTDNQVKTYFPRPDETRPKDEQIRQMARDLLLWVAEQEEKNGRFENATRLRAEAEKAMKL
jgi:hypothetical protein